MIYKTGGSYNSGQGTYIHMETGSLHAQLCKRVLEIQIPAFVVVLSRDCV